MQMMNLTGEKNTCETFGFTECYLTLSIGCAGGYRGSGTTRASERLRYQVWHDAYLTRAA
jgi:hypothetical protein